MLNIKKEEEKRIMLDEIEYNNWETEVDLNSSYEEIEEVYNEMKKAYDAAEDDMFPNGRDYDAENFDD